MANLDIIRGRQVVIPLTNQTGGAVIAGDVVVLDPANDNAFITTTTAGDTRTVGIVQESIAAGGTGRVLTSGYAPLVNVPAAVTRGHYLATHTVAKQAAGSATRGAGTMGQFSTGGATPSAVLWGAPSVTGTTGPAGPTGPTGPAGALIVEEVDGAPTDPAVTKIVFPNGTLTIVGHVATYTPTGGGGGGSGTGPLGFLYVATIAR